METPMLHLVGPCRDGSPGMIAGDAAALMRLRAAIDTALAYGIGSAELFSSDYEPYDLLVVAPPNMWNVCTAYAGEVNPVRSKRETLSLDHLWHLHGARTLHPTGREDNAEPSQLADTVNQQHLPERRKADRSNSRPRER